MFWYRFSRKKNRKCKWIDWYFFHRFWCDSMCRNREIWTFRWYWFRYRCRCCRKNRWNKRSKRANDCWLFLDFVREFWCKKSKIRLDMLFAYVIVKLIFEVEILLAMLANHFRTIDLSDMFQKSSHRRKINETFDARVIWNEKCDIVK